MQNEIIVNSEPGETRVAFLERSAFAELHIERDQGRSVVGNVVKGRVSRVLPGMQAAFVDIGLEKAGFLYVGDYFANLDPKSNGKGSRGGPRRGRSNQRSIPKIESVLSEGQEIVVQIAKEPIGSKGARITSNISIPGRHLVLTPWAKRVGVSRRIESDRERRRLKDIVSRLKTGDLGFIIRTAGDGVREADLEADVRYLTTVWEKIQSRHKENSAPAVLYSEPDLPLRVVRDLANGDTKRITIDSAEVHGNIKEFVENYVADPKPKVEHYRDGEPIFDHFDLESQIHANLERKVWLKSGGHLVVDQSEALTAIDVNTGRYIGKRDLEETVLRTNLEAVKEVVYQVRFRNIGGLIIIDLIDMESAQHREKVYRSLQEALRNDKARTNILKISELGLVEMTRKRTRENLVQTLCEPCAFCEGRGYVLSRESVAFRILREVRRDLPRFCGRQIAIAVSPQVAEQLLANGGSSILQLGEDLDREIEVRARPGLHQEQFEVTALDSGSPIAIPLRWLEDRTEESDDKSPTDTDESPADTDEAPASRLDVDEAAVTSVDSAPEPALETTAEDGATDDLPMTAELSEPPEGTVDSQEAEEKDDAEPPLLESVRERSAAGGPAASAEPERPESEATDPSQAIDE